MNVVEIEGIGGAIQEKLRAAGIVTADDLLRAGRTAAGRARLSEATGIREPRLLEWINHADLMRITGVGPEYADLLEEAGVDTVPELARRNAVHLHATLEVTNGEQEVVRRLPSVSAVEGWVAEAKRLVRSIEY